MQAKQANPKFSAGRNGELLKAMAHPLKERILIALDETQASPSELADRLDEDFQAVARHVRELKSTEPPLIEEVAVKTVRGGTAHVYKFVGRPVLDIGPWEQQPKLMREIQSTQAGKFLLGDLAEAMEAGTFDANTQRTFVRDVLILDQEGRGEVEAAGEAYLEAISQSAARSAGRLAESDERGGRFSVSAMAFEVP